MGLITDEQTVKSPSEFLKLEAENDVALLSNVYQIKSHWINSQKTSVACLGEKCSLCAGGQKFRMEYYYFGSVNGEKGFVRIPATVFFTMNKVESFLKKKDPKIDKRSYSWLVMKSGEGRDTEYATSKNDLVKIDMKEIEENNEKLVKVMSGYEKRLKERLEKVLTVEESSDQHSEDVDPSDIPF
jgi:hypothetical protein